MNTHDPIPSDRPHDAHRGSYPGEPMEYPASPCAWRFDFTSACLGGIVAMVFALIIEVIC